ncbi:aspartate/glutamate racemase family protein [Rhodovulum sp. MB263]|uniref:aspartate/glutamate racemase family protein n=1 Tax=Rhodovulum sp. (strain MB263) TaxID=308754 RepID=UPI0009B77EE8|nr:aspartate/glutamate racemase family protein [Rhodovulum sp. MB263]ARC87358.1 aspartate racemase [Rhodovulum sp. MB263]
MKTIGILGGMSAASTALYYEVLNRGARARLGGLHSADLLIRSLDFALVEEMQAAGDWEAASALLNREARRLEAGGADFLMLATNTMHKLVEPMLEGVSIPFLHIADATAHQIGAAGLKRPGLMATAYTMEQSFYTDRLRAAGLAPMLPGPEDRAETHRIIYDELCIGTIREESRQSYVEIAGRLAKRGADCVILGCTEVGLLLNAANAPLPVFDTTEIHCAAALDLALAA